MQVLGHDLTHIKQTIEKPAFAVGPRQKAFPHRPERALDPRHEVITVRGFAFRSSPQFRAVQGHRPT